MRTGGINKRGSNLVTHFSAANSAGTGLTGLTVKFSIYDYASGFYWDNASGDFDSGTEVLNTGSEIGYGLYEYALTGGYALGGNEFRIHVEATQTVTGDIYDTAEVYQTLGDANLVSIDGAATSGYNAVLKLKQLDIQNNTGSAIIAKSTGGNGQGIDIAGNGAGNGINVAAGATGNGLNLRGGVTSGNGFDSRALGSNGNGIQAVGKTNGEGAYFLGGETGGTGLICAAQAGNGRGAYFTGAGGGAGLICIGGPSNGNGASFCADAYADVASSAGIYCQARENGSGLYLIGYGSGAGLSANGGATGPGADFQGGGTSGNGINVEANSGDSDGMSITGQGAGYGLNIVAGSTGEGLYVSAAGGNGAVFSGGNGHGITAYSVGGNGDGLNVTGNGSGVGLSASGGSSGAGAEFEGGSGDTDGVIITGKGAGYGLNVVAGPTGQGIYVSAVGGTAVYLTSGNGSGIYAISSGGNGDGITAAGNGSGAGLSANGGATGKDIDADEIPHSIKKNTAIAKFKFVMIDATTGNPASGFTVTAAKKLDADATWTAMTGSGTIVDNGSGVYSIDVSAADTNGNTGVWRFTAPGAEVTLITFVTELT